MIDKSLGIGGAGVGSTGPISSGLPGKPEKSTGPSGFESLLDNAINSQPLKPGSAGQVAPEGLKFSQHALDRMASRGITFKPEDILKLNDAIEKASKKGSKESLILMGDNALIVSVKNKTIVTAMDREAMKENVFTNIDSTVIL